MKNRLKKIYYVLMLGLCMSVNSYAEYDEELAASVGADDYGMKSYVMVLLVTGDKTVEDKAERDKAFAGHFANMSQLAEEKKLVVAGPFVEARPKRGLFIFNTDSLETAEAWVKTDPAVKAGIFNYELYKIYSSAALMLVNEQHKKLQKTAM
ncbi:YciI family protein [Alteromonas sp. W364]|uniref:YciI family protein n=1 Tax=Alteromonas sp. W364 TaxID=3075610 RepID=UPI0028857C1B|nr:YciI family protein [Alteromonas sp. W364]MDT0628128.1 YciI family protein [Alteromonas sp. W364]